jgi:hypothetical protein
MYRKALVCDGMLLQSFQFSLPLSVGGRDGVALLSTAGPLRRRASALPHSSERANDTLDSLMFLGV